MLKKFHLMWVLASVFIYTSAISVHSLAEDVSSKPITKTTKYFLSSYPTKICRENLPEDAFEVSVIQLKIIYHFITIGERLYEKDLTTLGGVVEIEVVKSLVGEAALSVGHKLTFSVTAWSRENGVTYESELPYSKDDLLKKFNKIYYSVIYRSKKCEDNPSLGSKKGDKCFMILNFDDHCL